MPLHTSDERSGFSRGSRDFVALLATCLPLPRRSTQLQSAIERRGPHSIVKTPFASMVHDKPLMPIVTVSSKRALPSVWIAKVPLMTDYVNPHVVHARRLRKRRHFAAHVGDDGAVRHGHERLNRSRGGACGPVELVRTHVGRRHSVAAVDGRRLRVGGPAADERVHSAGRAARAGRRAARAGRRAARPDSAARAPAAGGRVRAPRVRGAPGTLSAGTRVVAGTTVSPGPTPPPSSFAWPTL